VSGYERVGQSTPKYMATGERQSVGFPVDSGFATHDNLAAVGCADFLVLSDFCLTVTPGGT
jgi:hypothetical protein